MLSRTVRTNFIVSKRRVASRGPNVDYSAPQQWPAHEAHWATPLTLSSIRNTPAVVKPRCLSQKRMRTISREFPPRPVRHTLQESMTAQRSSMSMLNLERHVLFLLVDSSASRKFVLNVFIS